MSMIDLRSRFWQIPLKERSIFLQIPLKESCRDYTAFVHNGKLYRFCVMSFGLSTSLSSLTRGLDFALNEEVKENTAIYVDDCLGVSHSIDEHLRYR